LVGTALNGRAHADVAVSMGISEHAVRQLVHRARTTLRGAVTGITPLPLARWLATAPSGAPPDVVLAAGAVSGTGVAVKLGAVLAATGALATGVVVGPLGHQPVRGVGRPAVTHSMVPPSGAVIQSARPISSQTVPAPAMRQETRRSRGSGSLPGARRSGVTPAAARGGSITSVPITNAGVAGVEQSISDDRSGAAAPERHGDSGPSESRGQSGGSASESSGSGSHDGHGGSAATEHGGSGSDGTGSGSDGGSSPAAGASGGDAVSGHDGASSTSDDGQTGTAAASAASGSGSAVATGRDGGSSNSDGGPHGGSHSGSDGDPSDTSTEGK
jgi:hypothetical protein